MFLFIVASGCKFCSTKRSEEAMLSCESESNTIIILE